MSAARPVLLASAAHLFPLPPTDQKRFHFVGESCTNTRDAFLVRTRYLDVTADQTSGNGVDLRPGVGMDNSVYDLRLPATSKRNRRFSTYDLTGSNTIGKGKMPHLSAIPRQNPEAWQHEPGTAAAPVSPERAHYGYVDVSPVAAPLSPGSPYASMQPSGLPSYLMSTPAVHVNGRSVPLPGAVAVGGDESSDDEDTYL